MKKLLIGCMAAIAVLTTLSGCDQDKVTYSGANYLMFSDTLYTYAVQETNEIFNVPVAATVATDYDRTFAVEVIDWESNAVEGKHYKLLSNTVTVKAGERTTSLQVQGMYDNMDITDSLGFSLRLVIPEEDQWNLYGTGTKVVMQKILPFDIEKFTRYCKITSTYLSSDFYPAKPGMRLVTSDVVKDKENTVVIHDFYYDGYDVEITFNRKEVLEPLVEMEEQICSTTAGAFSTVRGDGKLRISQPAAYTSFYSTNENFVMQYTTLSVKNKDGSIYDVLGTFANIIEWISDAEAEKLKEQGY